jgi:RNA processing factor Prp31
MLDLVDQVKSAIDNAQASIGTDGMPAAIRNMESVARQCLETYDRREDILTGAAGQ